MKEELRKYMKSGDVYFLSGPANKANRQAVMQVLTGIRLPVSRCGVNALWRGMIEVSSVTGNCLAHQERAFTVWLNS